MHKLFDLKSHDSFQNKNNRKAIHSFAPRPQNFKLQQEVLKLSDICVSWKETTCLNLENRGFENVSFSQ